MIQSTETMPNKGLGHGGDYILLPDQPAVEQGQARHHEEHQCCSHEHPGGVTGV